MEPLIPLSSKVNQTNETAVESWTFKVPEGCSIQNSFKPWDNAEDILTYSDQYWSTTFLLGILTPILFLFGAPFNVLNAAIFYKQGLRERINMCLFALALMDLGFITVQGVMAAEYGFGRFFYIYSSVLFFYLVGATGFVFASQFLSCVIACERCFCVVSPFKAQKYLKTSTMAAIITVSCVILIGGVCVIAGHKHTMVCEFDPFTAQLITVHGYTQFYLRYRYIFDQIDIFVYATAFPLTVFIVIVFSTIVTIYKIHVTVKWRQSVVSSTKTSLPTSPDMSSKEMGITKMLVATSIFFIVCLMPLVLYQMTYLVVPGFSYDGRYHNLVAVCWDIIIQFRMASCSFNFVVYYIMGSRFRSSLKELFSPCASRRLN